MDSRVYRCEQGRSRIPSFFIFNLKGNSFTGNVADSAALLFFM